MTQHTLPDSACCVRQGMLIFMSQVPEKRLLRFSVIPFQ